MVAINNSSENLPLRPVKLTLFFLTTDYNCGESTYLKLMQAERGHTATLIPGSPSDWMVVQETNQCSQELLMRSAKFLPELWWFFEGQYFPKVFSGRNFSYPIAENCLNHTQILYFI